jgi:hypothetical protein
MWFDKLIILMYIYVSHYVGPETEKEKVKRRKGIPC